MLTIKRAKLYTDEHREISLLVSNYGREYAVTGTREDFTIHGTGGQRGAAAWKVKADARAITEFVQTI